MYSKFQTKKEYRKKISSINLEIKFDFLKDNLSVEKLIIDNESNQNINYILQQFNLDSRPIKNRIDLRNFFNSIIEEL